MIAVFDIGNTHTHIGVANSKRVVCQTNVASDGWADGSSARTAARFLKSRKIHGAALCSVVPTVTPLVARFVKEHCQLPCLKLTSQTVRNIGIDYPKPETIGPDRLANAVAAREHFGAPLVVVDFGTAVTFDVVNGRGNYVGGIITPGLAAMTGYLHEKTALLPKIEIREVEAVIGKNTEEAMIIGAVHGYRGLVRELIAELKRELKVRHLPVIATGGYAGLIAAKLPEITSVEPMLTLEGLRLFWEGSQVGGIGKSSPRNGGGLVGDWDV
jgi:type III pantothenate kinase